jgi:hypothetical protein
MFSYFDEPMHFWPLPYRPSRCGYTSHRPVRHPVFNSRQRIQSIFDDFMDSVEDHFFDAFDGMETDPHFQLAHDQRDKPAADQPQDGEKSDAKAPEERPTVRKYFSESRSSRFNGGDAIEERRERVTGADGVTRTVTLRRIGDRWHEHERIEDKSGQVSQKESWHNIPESEMERFTSDWEQRALGQRVPPSVTHDAPKKE